MWSVKRQRLRVALLEQQVVVDANPHLTGRSTLLPTGVAASDTGPRWAGAVNALGQWLQDNPHKGAGLHVYLSSELVRWMCLPWPMGLVQPEALHGYAEARLQATFGTVAEQWRLLNGDVQPGQPVVACAMDEALVAALHALAQTHGLKLDHLEPYFAAAHDHWHPHLRRGTVWFVGLEPGAMTVGLLHKGQWLGLRSVRLANAGAGAEDWPTVLAGVQGPMRIGCDHAVGDNTPVFVTANPPSGRPALQGHTHLVPQRLASPANTAGPVSDTDLAWARMAWGV